MGKKLFVEYTRLEPGQLVPVALTEAETKAGASGHWTAPVWHLDTVNLNGRVYTSELAQRICAENQVTGACDGHEPDPHKEYRNVVAVVKNPAIKDGFMCVDIYMVDPVYEEKLKKCREMGLPIGVSSTGYGETDANGRVVTGTYELVRYLDFVMNPAGVVYASPENERKGPEDGNGKPTGEPGSEAAAALKAKAKAYLELEHYLRGETK